MDFFSQQDLADSNCMPKEVRKSVKPVEPRPGIYNGNCKVHNNKQMAVSQFAKSIGFTDS